MIPAQHSQFHRYRRAAARGRMLSWLAVLVFLFQLLAAGAHHHDAPAKSPHCVACALHVQPYAGPPDALLAPAPAGWRLLHALARPLPSRVAAPRPGFLRPPAHAPPAFLSE